MGCIHGYPDGKVITCARTDATCERCGHFEDDLEGLEIKEDTI